MLRSLRHAHRRFSLPLALLWLLVSNAALCAASASVAVPLPHSPHQHAAPAHHHGEPQQDAHGCCASVAVAKPCCGDASFAPSYDAPQLSKLQAIPLSLAHLERDFGPQLSLLEHPLFSPPAQGSPPLFILVCSLLI